MGSIQEQLSLTAHSPELPGELSLEERLKKARTDLAVLYLEYGVICGEKERNPYHYKNINDRSHEIADKHAECVKLELQILGRSAVSN